MYSDELPWVTWAIRHIVDLARHTTRCYIDLNEFLRITYNDEPAEAVVARLPSTADVLTSPYHHTIAENGHVLLDKSTFIWLLLTSPRYCHLDVVVAITNHFAQSARYMENMLCATHGTHIIYLCRLLYKVHASGNVRANCYQIGRVDDVDQIAQALPTDATIVCTWNAKTDDMCTHIMQAVATSLQCDEHGTFWADDAYIHQLMNEIRWMIEQGSANAIKNKLIQHLRDAPVP